MKGEGAIMRERLLEFFEQIPESDDILIKGYEKDAVREISCREFRERVFGIASFLKDKGIISQDRVAVIAEKCPETIAVFFAIWLNGGIAVPICETLQPRELSFILGNSGAKMILCSENLKKRIEGCLAPLEITTYDFSSWKGISLSEVNKESFALKVKPEDTAFLIYTSGSMGNPKGVILSHQNVAFNAAVGGDYIGKKKTDAVMSVLPYWHSFAITAEIFTMMHTGGKIYIPRNKATFMKDIALFGPTIILSVPRIAEMIKKGIEGSVKKKSPLEQKIFKFAQKTALKYHLTPAKKRGPLEIIMYHLTRKVILKKIKEGFGGRIRYFIGGAAPLDISLEKFFLSIDIPIYQGYGLTEASPVISINAPHDFAVGTSGKMLSWMTEEYGGDYTFEDESGKKDKKFKGELLVKGKCVMAGYWGMKEETSRALKDGWLYTGDMGYINEEGYLILFGRKKNLLCLKGGEKFYPEFIEEQIKTSPYILQAMIIGEGCARSSVLVNINQDLLKGKTAEEIDKIIAQDIRQATHDFETYQRPARHLILPEFTMEEDLLTNTLKIRRHRVLEKYNKEIGGLLKRIK
ncbi:MAG: AMP-binding protein [Candidatus Omnitrophica bacterium]|nr:AMP-binding protein [Candidatus Omnitrophota bacterium]